ncbi:MAG: RluA family pseudouridine synthase [Treponema sp.]|nr:RluA family pseudouridine synthase [Treponema sp.]
MPALRCSIDDAIPEGMRLDRYVAEYLRLFSRSQSKVRKLEGKVNNKKVKLSFPVRQGDDLELVWNDVETPELIPEKGSLDIVYEDDQVVVINKGQNIVVHPGAGNYRGTLANFLYFRQLEKGASVTNSLRPGIVHRLDKDTSGVIIAAWNDTAHAFLSEQFKARTVKKTYVALVNGILKNETGRIETHIARDPGNRMKFAVSEKGKTAVTLFRVIKTWQTHTLVMLRPRTGRTHQLRVHMKYLGHPITGDMLYGIKDTLFPQATLMLHARTLELTLPENRGRRKFSAPLPERFSDLIRKLDRIESGRL